MVEIKKRLKAFFTSLADWCINMSAGAFGVVIYTPSAYKLDKLETVLILIINIIVGILFFSMSVKIKTKL